MKKIIVTITLISFILLGCENTDEKTFGIFNVQENETTVVTDGSIDSYTLDDFNEMLENFPNITQIIMHDMPGSIDDEANIQLAKAVYQAQLHIHIEDGYDVVSGAVDLFLAGKTRTKGETARFGVHSWSDGYSEATDFPEDSPEHDLYLHYFQEIGMSEAEASAFYFFTINAAPHDDIHWMTNAEIQQYNMLTE